VLSRTGYGYIEKTGPGYGREMWRPLYTLSGNGPAFGLVQLHNPPERWDGVSNSESPFEPGRYQLPRTEVAPNYQTKWEVWDIHLLAMLW
jgi:hypothetical protein